MNPEKLNFKVGVAACCTGQFNRPATELMIGMFNKAGVETTTEISQADAFVINTCAFLQNGESQTGKVIGEILSQKKSDAKIYASGCLIAKYGKETIKQMLPFLEKVYTNHQENQIVVDVISDFNHKLNTELSFLNRKICNPLERSWLPISDGCNMECTFCSLPKYRGQLKSRSLLEIKQEIENLTQQNATNIAIGGLETTSYGQDLNDGSNINDIIQILNNHPKIKKFHLSLAHPNGFDDKLIKSITNSPKLSSIEMPIQHINNEILQKMGRNTTKEKIESTLQKIRQNHPDIILYTTFIVGFPGETESDFKELIDFLDKGYFNAFGGFAYSPEPDTIATRFNNQVSKEIKNQRGDFITSHFPNGYFNRSKYEDTTLEERLKNISPDKFFIKNKEIYKFLNQAAGKKDLALETMDNDFYIYAQVLKTMINSINENSTSKEETELILKENFSQDFVDYYISAFSPY